MEKCNFEVEEYFEKCRAVLRVLDEGSVGDEERATLIWIARDYLDELGCAIGITKKK